MGGKVDYGKGFGLCNKTIRLSTWARAGPKDPEKLDTISTGGI